MKRVLLSEKQRIGIIDAEFPISLEETIESVQKSVGEKPVHFVDYCAWKESENQIRETFKKEGYEIDDHHNSFSVSGVLTAASSVKARQDSGELPELERIVLTFRPNFDGDLILSTYLALNPKSKYRKLVEKAAIFSDCTMFGGKVFNKDYVIKKQEEVLALALNQVIYEETVENFPKELSFLKGFPADKRGIAEAVLKGYENIMARLNSMLRNVNTGEVREKAEKYLARVRSVNERAVERGQELIPGKMVYLDLRKEPLDTSPTMAFWLAEGNGQFTADANGNIKPIVLRETPTGYTLASADNRTNINDVVAYDLTKAQTALKELTGKDWTGKSTVLFGSRGDNGIMPEQIAEVLKLVYKI